MANDKSNYLRGVIYKAILRNTSFQGAATLYMSLHTGAPGVAGANEVAGNNYARIAISFAADANGAGASNINVAFAAPTPANWGTITHFGIWDAAAAGNFYGGDALTFAVATSIGVPVTFPSGNVTWTET